MNRRITMIFVMMVILIMTFLSACTSTRQTTKREPLVKVDGTVYEPSEGSHIYLYREGKGPYGPADYILPLPTGEDGRFTINVEPGIYTMVARKRRSGENTGPLQEGDIRSDEIVIHVRENSPQTLSVLLAAKIDNTVKSYSTPDNWNTSISGKVLDADGDPVSGARVHVYTYIQMSERPKYVGERTGSDGGYTVYLPRGGTYYLAARNRFGGPPRIGDLYGRYDKGSIDPSAVVVKEGEQLEGIDIIVFKVW
jgi:hypothetical protein